MADVLPPLLEVLPAHVREKLLADWGFMLGLLGIGVALLSGVDLRLAAVAGSAMMVP